MAGLWCQTALKQQDSHSLLCVIAVAPQSAERCMGEQWIGLASECDWCDSCVTLSWCD